ncbi:unnamed protein product, partial [Clonostachys rhizophaga]
RDRFADSHLAVPTLTYAHLQAAQLIAVGKRAAACVQDLMLDLHGIEKVRNELNFRDAQRTTGCRLACSPSLLMMFLERLLMSEMRFEKVCGLARELPSKPATFANTHADQCCERTLDGSIIRR